MSRVITGSDGRKYLTDEPMLHSPKREWAELKWDDVPEEWVGNREFAIGARWAESKLKEKNT